MARVKYTSKDGKHQVQVADDDKLEINRLRALGYRPAKRQPTKHTSGEHEKGKGSST